MATRILTLILALIVAGIAASDQFPIAGEDQRSFVVLIAAVFLAGFLVGGIIR